MPSDEKESPSKPATIVDIAKAAGVTSMTVSRVMKGYQFVSPKTREKVLRVAQEMNYTVNLSARALVTGQTGVIAILSERLSNPYYANLVHSMGLQLEAHGYVMRLLHTDEESQTLINSTNSSTVDGIIVFGLYGALEYLKMKPNRSQPYVCFSASHQPGSDSIQIDLCPAVVEAVHLMMNAGRKRIAYVGPGELAFPQDTICLVDRAVAYRHEMEKAGRDVELIGIPPNVEGKATSRIETLKEYFQRHGCPDGLICFNDGVALHVFRALMDLGYRIPDDVMLVGCDDLPFMKFFEPPLSSISQPTAEICALVWKFLQTRMADPELPPQSATFTARLMVRKSLLH